MRFIDLFAGLGGFHHALASLGHECVFVSEIDPELRATYKENFPEIAHAVYGDIRQHKDLIPPHDILCAGFPCQPFSKSGLQLGMQDATRGTLFHEIVEILQAHQPQYIILENVGNFERHDEGRTWAVVRARLQELGYHVKGTTHRASHGHGLISPHHFGHPHHRERFFIIGRRETPFEGDPFPRGDRKAVTHVESIVQDTELLTAADLRETQLTPQQVECIDQWNELIQSLPADLAIPSVPLWGDEITATYEYEGQTPYDVARAKFIATLGESHPAFWSSIQEELDLLPSYARKETFPRWKRDFIRKNRSWFAEARQHMPPGWVERLQRFPASLRKMEWNCKGEDRDLWRCVLQFRPSGLRAKRYSSVPALVAMTTTQIPILGPERRFLTRVEGLRLQGLPDTHKLPRSRERAFAALGNGVHVDVVQRIAAALLETVRAIPTAQTEIAWEDVGEVGPERLAFAS